MKKYKQKFNLIFCFCLLTCLPFLFSRCAVEQAPGGGPEDKRPPEIVFTFPAADSTSISPGKIEIEFSEPVDKTSVEKAVFVSPFQMNPLKFKWKKKRLTITLGDSLLDSTTYVISIGSSAKDIRNNQMRRSYTWAFSTGEKIDNGAVEGRLFGQEAPSGIYVWGFRLTGQDTLGPTYQFPQYVTQTGEDGSFRLAYLSPGIYRLFLIKDVNGDKDYWPESDMIGIPQKDVVLDGDSAFTGGLNYLLSKVDTTGPRMISAIPDHNRRVQLKFTELPDSAERRNISNYSIIDTFDNPIEINMIYEDEDNAGAMILYTGLQDSNKVYFVKAQNLIDNSGNQIINAGDTVSFSGSIMPDTVQPLLKNMSFRDSAKAVDWREPFRFRFSEAMDRQSVEKNIQILDSDTNLLNLNYYWRTPEALAIMPADGFKEEKGYTLYFEPDSMFDLKHNSVFDSIKYAYFLTGRAGQFGSVMGEIRDTRPDSGAFYISLLEATGSSTGFTEKAESDGKFSFTGIKPGVYKFTAFRDRDGNGKYSFGNEYPFTPAERFIFLDDEIEVRAGWDSEGFEIVFR